MIAYSGYRLKEGEEMDFLTPEIAVVNQCYKQQCYEYQCLNNRYLTSDYLFKEMCMKLSKPVIILIVLVCLGTIAFIVYGLRTDCARTSGYVDCSEPKDKL